MRGLVNPFTGVPTRDPDGRCGHRRLDRRSTERGHRLGIATRRLAGHDSVPSVIVDCFADRIDLPRILSDSRADFENDGAGTKTGPATLTGDEDHHDRVKHPARGGTAGTAPAPGLSRLRVPSAGTGDPRGRARRRIRLSLAPCGYR